MRGDEHLESTGLPAGDADSVAAGKRQMRWLLAWRGHVGFSMGCAVAAPLLGGALLLPQVWCLAYLLGGVAAGELSVGQARPWVMAIVALLLLRALLSWAGDRAASLAAGRVKTLVRRLLFTHVLQQGPQWTRRHASGQLASALTEQVDSLEGFFSRYIPALVAAVVLPLAFGVIVLPFDWIAGLLLLVTAPLIPFFMVLVGWGAEAASRTHQQAVSRLSGMFADRLRGIFTLKLFGRAGEEVRTVRRASRDLRYKTLAVLRVAFLSSAVLEFFAALGVAGVAVYIGLGYLGHLGLSGSELSLTAGLFCLFMAPEVYQPLRSMAASYHDRANARAAVAELEQLFGELPEESRFAGFPDAGARSPDKAPASRRPAMAVELRNVTVSAAQRSAPVLDCFHLSVAASETVALMGRSGVGKTTLLETLTGMRRLDAGSIRVGGVAVTSGSPLCAGQGVVLIGQTPFFFPDTIAANLRLACPDADSGKLQSALEQAQAWDFVRQLPDGMETVLGAGGYGLSGGQLHRLALARLFLTNPGLILLDEPTAHLDAQTRDRVMDVLLDFAQDRTLILVTHDDAVASRCGRTVVLEDSGEGS